MDWHEGNGSVPGPIRTVLLRPENDQSRQPDPGYGSRKRLGYHCRGQPSAPPAPNAGSAPSSAGDVVVPVRSGCCPPRRRSLHIHDSGKSQSIARSPPPAIPDRRTATPARTPWKPGKYQHQGHQAQTAKHPQILPPRQRSVGTKYITILTLCRTALDRDHKSAIPCFALPY